MLARPPVVKAAAPLTVTSDADGGGTCPGADCTLRQAIATAQAGETINFAVGVTTINLTTDKLLINRNLTINGPGANLLTVRRSTGNFRIFQFASGGVNTISGLTIANGSGNFGGGIFNESASILTVTGCSITGNGGGIYNGNATLTVINSTISGNVSGGGIFNSEGIVNITSATISGNSGLGGILNGGGTVNITNATISGNSSVGISNPVGAVNARNTIIALNSGADVNGPLSSQGYNLIGNTNNNIFGTSTGNQLNVTAAQLNLGPLHDNGGPTLTHALGSGSFAIEKGHSSGSITDQRGFARPVVSPLTSNPIGDGSDIGAYEVQADILPGCDNVNLVVNNNNDDASAGSLRAVIANACAGSTIIFAFNVRGAITLASELLIAKPLIINGPRRESVVGGAQRR
jgi:hypothetical protein